MGLRMPQPTLIGNRYYLRVAPPADLAKAVKGQLISIPIDGAFKSVRIGTHVKVSLGTSDLAEALKRYLPAYQAVLAYWEAVRNGPQKLTHKTLFALAGQIRADWINVFDENPETPEIWERVIAANESALGGGRDKLAVLVKGKPQVPQQEERFGAITDAFLRSKGLVIDAVQRGKLIMLIGETLNEAARVNQKKASGDYSDTGDTTRYPPLVLEERKPKEPQKRSKRITLTTILEEEVKLRSLGQDGKPLNRKTEGKYRKVLESFVSFTGNEDASMITARECDAWKRDMLESGELSGNTIKQRIQNLRTIVDWGRRQELGDLLPNGNPLKLVSLPQYRSVPSEERTYTRSEATLVLHAARKQVRSDLRWLPWLCAYSGARVNEVAQLTPGDFFRSDGHWFYKITTMGQRSLKNEHGIRRVPVHKDLVKEGLIDFLEKKRRSGMDKNIFPKRAALNVSSWIREDLKVTRQELAPNHGWRHLFEDLAMAGGMSDSAKIYITGRSGGGSARGYGKGFEMLPGLAQQMNLVHSILR
ncbi:MAG: hypothetical protein BM560_14145 [Roseobacter sp. MedPE-SWde]|nr:MAG: hypothetical protein BM560_14145 [Roseobacter sp. MedPE-SWde]